VKEHSCLYDFSAAKLRRPRTRLSVNSSSSSTLMATSSPSYLAKKTCAAHPLPNQVPHKCWEGSVPDETYVTHYLRTSKPYTVPRSRVPHTAPPRKDCLLETADAP